MITFSEEKYNELQANQSYGELADYLEQFTFSNRQQEQFRQNTIIELRKQNKIQNSIYSQMQANGEQDAILADKFLKGFNSGVLPKDDNHYVTEYKKLLRDLGSTDNKIATGIELEMNKNRYNLFLKQSGFTENDLKANNIRKIEKDGKIYIGFEKSNPLFNNILAGIKSPSITTYTAMKRFTSIPVPVDVYGNMYDDLSVKGIESINGQSYYVGDKTNGNKLQALNRFISNLSDYKNETIQKYLSTDNYSQSTITTGHLGAGMADLYKLFRQGQIDETQFKTYKAQIEDTYNRELAGIGLTQFAEVYASTPGSKTETMSKLDSEQIYELNKILKYAMAENRVSYQAAINGGELGTYISISPEVGEDKAKVIDIEDDARSGYTIFVPGLFKEKAAESFNRNTKTRAARELNEAAKWQISYDFHDGSKIDNVTNNGAVLENADGVRGITREDAIREINRDLIIREGIRNAENMLYTSNTGEINPNADLNLIKAKVQQLSFAAINDLYGIEMMKPNGELKNKEDIPNYQFAMKESFEISTYILNALNITEQ